MIIYYNYKNQKKTITIKSLKNMKSLENKNNTVKNWNTFEAMSTLSAVYYNDSDKMNDYIERMLNDYCVHNFMAYMELLDTIGFTAYLFNTVLYMKRKEGSLFQIIKDDDKFLATLEKWYNKMMYTKSFYSKYCTDYEIEKVWLWLN